MQVTPNRQQPTRRKAGGGSAVGGSDPPKELYHHRQLAGIAAGRQTPSHGDESERVELASSTLRQCPDRGWSVGPGARPTP